MTRYILYASVDGSNLRDVADVIDRRLRQFVETTPWVIERPLVVNERGEVDPSLDPDDLPTWTLGLNLNLPHPASAPPNWFDDIDRIVRVLAELHVETGKDFVIGVGDRTRPWFSDDLMFVDSATPDVKDLRRILGAGPA